MSTMNTKASTRIPTPAAPLKVTVEVPLVESKRPQCHYLQLGGITRKHWATLSRLTDGLIAEGAQLADGRHVEKPSHALKWVLEQIAEKVGS